VDSEVIKPLLENIGIRFKLLKQSIKTPNSINLINIIDSFSTSIESVQKNLNEENKMLVLSLITNFLEIYMNLTKFSTQTPQTLQTSENVGVINTIDSQKDDPTKTFKNQRDEAMTIFTNKEQKLSVFIDKINSLIQIVIDLNLKNPPTNSKEIETNLNKIKGLFNSLNPNLSSDIRDNIKNIIDLLVNVVEKIYNKIQKKEPISEKSIVNDIEFYEMGLDDENALKK